MNQIKRQKSSNVQRRKKSEYKIISSPCQIQKNLKLKKPIRFFRFYNINHSQKCTKTRCFVRKRVRPSKEPPNSLSPSLLLFILLLSLSLSPLFLSLSPSFSISLLLVICSPTSGHTSKNTTANTLSGERLLIPIRLSVGRVHKRRVLYANLCPFTFFSIRKELAENEAENCRKRNSVTQPWYPRECNKFPNR